MESRRKMTDPGAGQAVALDHAIEDRRIRVRKVAEWIRADERVEVVQESWYLERFRLIISPAFIEWL